MGYQLAEFKDVVDLEGLPKRTYEMLTAFRKDKFELIDKLELPYYSLCKEYQSEEFKKPNRAMILMLRSCDNPNDCLVVVNTQLFHGDELDYVRQAQSLYLM